MAADWRVDVLRGLGAPVTKNNLSFLTSWQRWEGGHTNNDARFNWLNTTSGSQYEPINPVGVRKFPNYRTGIRYTLRTIRNGRYGDIIKALRSGDPYKVSPTAGLSTWVSGSPSGNLEYAQKVLGSRADVDIPALPTEGSKRNKAAKTVAPGQNVTSDGQEVSPFSDLTSQILASRGKLHSFDRSSVNSSERDAPFADLTTKILASRGKEIRHRMHQQGLEPREVVYQRGLAIFDKQEPGLGASEEQPVPQPKDEKPPAKGEMGKPGGGWGGSYALATRAADIAKEMGLSVISEKRDTKHTASGGVSDHWSGSKTSYAYDLSNGSSPTPEMDAAAVRLARMLGEDYDGKSELVLTKTIGGYRFQIIYRSNVGGNHYNHIHFGVRKA